MDDEQFKLILLSANTSSLIQSMEQGAISKCKKIFQHRLLRWALQYEGRIAQFYADCGIKDCIDLIHESWCRINSIDMFHSWGKILNRWNSTDTNTRSDSIATITEQSFELISAERVDEWIIEYERGEMNTKDADIKDEDCSIVPSLSSIEDAELDRLLYNLRKIVVTEPELETQAKSIIDYYDKKNYL